MEKQTNGIRKALGWSLAAAVFLAASQNVLAQQSQGQSGQASGGAAPAPTIDAATGKVLNEAIELLNMENFAGAGAKIATLNLDKLSPYERSKVEQILFNIAYSQDKYDEARGHLQKAIEAGGLNAQEVEQARYQAAQLFMTQEKWKEGAAALEEWFKSATNPNSAAYYLLAVAYYQQDDFARALPPAKKAVELMDKPQEGWLGMLSALYLQRDEYKEAVPILQQLISVVPEKKTYWMQLSSVYGQMEDYPNALAIMQLAYGAGLVTEDQEIRRLADLLVFNGVPYRGAQVLESAITNKVVALDDKLYEKLANCWIAAGEFDKSTAPLQRAAELSANGDIFVRLGEVHVQREDWAAAIDSIQRGLDKGQLKDPGNAQLLMGIAYFSEKKYSDARPFFERAQRIEKHRQIATSYLQAISAQT
jgi:tetratricopeptide (TPR) repeat protein